MKTQVRLLLLLSFIFVQTQAQLIPNAGFENWGTKNLYEEPNEFFTSNGYAYGNIGKGNVSKTSSASHGAYGIKLETLATENDTIAGSLIIGIPAENGIKGGIPYTGTPDSISFYAKYTIQPSDMAYFIIAFKKEGEYIAQAICTFSDSQETYKRFKIATSLSAENPPDSLVAFITSSRMDPPRIPESTLWLDSITMLHSDEQIPNSNFEEWVTLETQEPADWQTLNMVSVGLGKQSATPSTSSHEGTYAIRIESVPTSYGANFGYITNGQFGNDGPPKGGLAVAANPMLVSGYYKYLPNGQDTALAALFSYRYNAIEEKSEIVEGKIVRLPPKENYTYFEILLNYNETSMVDTLNITFAANDMENQVFNEGSVLYIDNLTISYYDLPTKTTLSQTNTTQIYRIGNNLYIDRIDRQISEISVINSIGQHMFNKKIEGNNTIIQIDNLKNGIYIYTLTNNNGSIAKTGKFILK